VDDDPVLPIDPDLAPPDALRPYAGEAGSDRLWRRRVEPGVLAAIAAGGVVGASARYGIARLLPTRPGVVPWATLVTNLAGSFLLGWLLVLFVERLPPTRYARPFVATGLIGAFTTMSTYAVEAVLLVDDGRPLTALAYGSGSVAGGVVLAYSGLVVGRRTPTMAGGPERPERPAQRHGAGRPTP
jgi:CrcB protein